MENFTKTKVVKIIFITIFYVVAFLFLLDGFIASYHADSAISQVYYALEMIFAMCFLIFIKMFKV